MNPADFKKHLKTNHIVAANNRASVRAISRFLPNARRPWFTASEIARIYNIPKPSSRPIVVGVMSTNGMLWGETDAYGLHTNGDVQAYWTSLGITNQPRVIVKDISGSVPSDAMATVQNTGVVEMIGACCPSTNLTIIVYNFTITSAEEFIAAYAYVISQRVSYYGERLRPTVVVSNFGAPEFEFTNTQLNNLNTLFTNAATQNRMTFISPADTQNEGGYVGYAFVPASCPSVVAVGGTSLNCPNRKYDRFTRETAWIGSGGGASGYFNKPPFQNGIEGSNRMVPDIAFNADPATGVKFFVDAEDYVMGGGAIAAATFGGLLAAYNRPKNRRMNDYLYKLPKNAFNDIKNGSNDAGFNAGQGYDLATGLGSVIGRNFAGLIDKVKFGVVRSLTIMEIDSNFWVGGKGILTLNSTTVPIGAPFTVSWTSDNPGIIYVEPYNEPSYQNAANYFVNGYGTVTISAAALDGSGIVARKTYNITY